MLAVPEFQSVVNQKSHNEITLKLFSENAVVGGFGTMEAKVLSILGCRTVVRVASSRPWHLHERRFRAEQANTRSARASPTAVTVKTFCRSEDVSASRENKKMRRSPRMYNMRRDRGVNVVGRFVETNSRPLQRLTVSTELFICRLSVRNGASATAQSLRPSRLMRIGYTECAASGFLSASVAQ